MLACGFVNFPFGDRLLPVDEPDGQPVGLPTGHPQDSSLIHNLHRPLSTNNRYNLHPVENEIRQELYEYETQPGISYEPGGQSLESGSDGTIVLARQRGAAEP